MLTLGCRPGLAVSIVLLLAVAPAGPLSAQTGQAAAPRPAGPPARATRDKALPSARSIIDRHIAAIGGRAAILARTSTHATGTVAISSAGMTGTVDVFAAK